MRLALLTIVVATGCNQSVPSIKNDAGDSAFEIVNPAGTFWETADFKTDTKLQLRMDGSGTELDAVGNAMQTFAWDALTPTSIEIFTCSATCVLQGLNEIEFSTADKFTAKVLPGNATVSTWMLVSSTAFP